MHRPLVGITLFYIAGIFLGFCLGTAFFHLRYLYPPLIILFLAIAFSFIRGKLSLSNIMLYICLLLLGTIAYLLKANPPHPNHISNLLQDQLEMRSQMGQGEEIERVQLEGTIVKDPQVRGTTRRQVALHSCRMQEGAVKMKERQGRERSSLSKRKGSG